MAERGELFGEGPAACPFVALELDRDRRSDAPDYRHRCFAEPTPQPRAIAHQEAYCLSPNFAACPIFQDWAIRAAARPVPGSAPVASDEVGAASVGLPLPALSSPDRPAPPLPSQVPAQVDVPPLVPAPDEPWPVEAFAPVDESGSPEQLEVFKTPAAVNEVAAMPSPHEHVPPYTPPVRVAPVEAAAPRGDEEPPVPGFLAGREGASRPPGQARSSRSGIQFGDKVKREDLVPSWELDGRFGAQAATDDGGGDRFGGLITMIAVVAILALGVAGVIFLPGLLAGGGPARTASPAPTVAPSDLFPSLTPVATTTPIVTNAPITSPSATPEPVATPRLYRIKAGDQLVRIARRFHVTVADILAFNPKITDPDHIEVGQVIVIPPPLPTAAP